MGALNITEHYCGTSGSSGVTRFKIDCSIAAICAGRADHMGRQACAANLSASEVARAAMCFASAMTAARCGRGHPEIVGGARLNEQKCALEKAVGMSLAHS